MGKYINVCLMSQQAFNNLTVKGKDEEVAKLIRDNPNDSSWLKGLIAKNDPLYVTKKYVIEDFELKTSSDGDYSKVDFDNSVTLWNALKNLPRYILCDERFWLWINFEKGYKAAVQAMPMTDGTTFSDHWRFGSGKRRGLFFGVLSRCFFRVALTYDEKLADPFELSKFAIESPSRFRNLTWRANSNLTQLVQGTLLAEKEYLSKHKTISSAIYPALAKAMSSVLAVRLADSMTKEDFYELAINKLNELGPKFGA